MQRGRKKGEQEGGEKEGQTKRKRGDFMTPGGNAVFGSGWAAPEPDISERIVGSPVRTIGCESPG